MNRSLLITVLSIFIFCLGAGYYAYTAIFGPNVYENPDGYTIEIPSGSNYDSVLTILSNNDVIINRKTFEWVSKLMKYKKDIVPPGKYEIEQNWSNRALVGHLRSGNQSPVKITFNNVRTLSELSGKITQNIELDSIEFYDYLKSKESLNFFNTDTNKIMTYFIPNTYEFYWNVKSKNLIKRIKKEYESFWEQKNREQLAKSINLNPSEVYTLASIVEKESLRKDEQRIIAGVYMNRLKRGMLLQADPTVVFAVGDFNIRRVLKKHLKFDSPYNTYIYAGLPPGPIAMPSISAIDAVLNYEKHEYLYFCAKPESEGRHAFANNISQHNENARLYREWLTENNIR